MTFSIFENLGTIARGQKLTNLCERKRKIQRFLSGALDMKNQQFDFLHLSGAWLKERHIKRHSLEQGTVSVGSLKGPQPSTQPIYRIASERLIQSSRRHLRSKPDLFWKFFGSNRT